MVSLRRILKSGNSSGSSKAMWNIPASARIWRARFSWLISEATVERGVGEESGRR